MVIYNNPPPSEKICTDFEIYLDNTKYAAYAARVSRIPYNTTWPGCERPIEQSEVASFVDFTFEGKVKVKLISSKDFEKITIRPLSKEINPIISGREIEFEIDKAGQYTVELDGYNNALHVFASSPCEYNTDENTIYFGAGIHHAGLIELHDNQTIYIERGAVVYGSILAINKKNIKVYGHGILDDSYEKRYDDTLLIPYAYNDTIKESKLLTKDYKEFKKFLQETKTLNGCVHFYNCQNCEISGIICRDSSTFTVILANCHNCVVDNIKLIGMWRYNSDGIDLFNCTNVVITNCFLRNFDDCIVIKGINGWDGENNQNILVFGCVIWCDWGRALEIGAETCADEYKNIIFENCDVIHNAHIAMDIQNGDRAKIHDVKFENIRIEYTIHQKPLVFQHDMDLPYPIIYDLFIPELINVMVYDGSWSPNHQFGENFDIKFNNIFVYLESGIERPRSQFFGIDNDHKTHDIQIENLYFNRVRASMQSEGNIVCREFSEKIILK